MIVVTDGESHDGEELPEALKECEGRNITRYAIAVSRSDQRARKRKSDSGSCLYVEHLRINTGRVGDDRCYAAERGAAHIADFWAPFHIPHTLCKKTKHKMTQW